MVTERYRGCLLGLAIGDALGTTLEFKAPGTFELIDDMIGGGSFHLKPGQWTDDTSMALCLADSLTERNDFDPIDQLERYCRWYRNGYLSSTGECFDIGITVREALNRFEQTKQPYCGATDEYSAGNGSIMRLAPVPMFYVEEPLEAIIKSGESSKTTHGNIVAVDACRYFGALIVGALMGLPKEQLLSEHFSPVGDLWSKSPLHSKISEIAGGSFKTNNPPMIQGTGYVVRSLEAALWAFYHSDSFKEGALMAVNLGDDADTTGAVYGQLAGAYYGEKGIPEEWKSKICMRDMIEKYAVHLYIRAKER
jgi:ADP-ribosyl-[dinitrogen reductase] hydrolase